MSSKNQNKPSQAEKILATKITNPLLKERISQKALQFTIDFYEVMNKLSANELKDIVQRIDQRSDSGKGMTALVRQGHEIAVLCNVINNNPTNIN